MQNKIRIYGDPVLRKKAKAFSLPEDLFIANKLLKQMFVILDEAEGLGLAAPQVGESVRLFVALPDHLEELLGHTVFINPIVQPYGNLDKKEEGCLSVPGIYESFFRPERAKITAFDETGQQFSLDLGGLSSRLVQHETDHLNGILFIDKLSSIKKKLIRRRLSKLLEDNRL